MANLTLLQARQRPGGGSGPNMGRSYASNGHPRETDRRREIVSTDSQRRNERDGPK